MVFQVFAFKNEHFLIKISFTEISQKHVKIWCDEIKCFNKYTLENRQKVFEYRKSKTYKRKSKYVDINLPENENNESEVYDYMMLVA